MVSLLGKAWDTACNGSQQYLENHSPVELPKGVLRSIGKSFVYSFLATSILSGGNLALGAIGGGLGALATSISIVARVAFQQIQNGLSHCLGKPRYPLALEGRVTADLIGVTATLACAAAAASHNRSLRSHSSSVG